VTPDDTRGMFHVEQYSVHSVDSWKDPDHRGRDTKEGERRQVCFAPQNACLTSNPCAWVEARKT
jgi:hypothetical protein